MSTDTSCHLQRREVSAGLVRPSAQEEIRLVFLAGESHFKGDGPGFVSVFPAYDYHLMNTSDAPAGFA